MGGKNLEGERCEGWGSPASSPGTTNFNLHQSRKSFKTLIQHGDPALPFNTSMPRREGLLLQLSHLSHSSDGHLYRASLYPHRAIQSLHPALLLLPSSYLHYACADVSQRRAVVSTFARSSYPSYSIPNCPRRYFRIPRTAARLPQTTTKSPIDRPRCRYPISETLCCSNRHFSHRVTRA